MQSLNEVVFTGQSGADGAVTEWGCLQGQAVQMVQSLNEVVFTGPTGADGAAVE